MTRRQRRVHRAVWWVVPAVVLAALVWADASRRRAERALAGEPPARETPP